MTTIENDRYAVDVEPHDGEVWIECGSGRISENWGFAIISKEDAKKLAEAILEVV